MREVRNLKRSEKLPPSLSAILPLAVRDAVERCAALRVEELRLHSGRRSSVTSFGKNYLLPVILTQGEMNQLLTDLCRGSLYAHSQTIHQGFLTLEDGVRVGVCGNAAMDRGEIIGVSEVSGLILRIPHPPRVEVAPVLSLLSTLPVGRGLLIYAPPGGGKTTLLRGLALELSRGEGGRRTVVVDSRSELSPWLGGEEHMLDTLIGYPRDMGIEIAVRSLGAEMILCDEIGNGRDAIAILQAANCGVPIIATVHAAHLSELLLRPSLERLHRARVFGAYVGLSRYREGLRYHFSLWEEADRLGTEAVGMLHASDDGASGGADAGGL